MITLYKWRVAWRLQAEVVPAPQNDPVGWGPADKFTVVKETAGFNAAEIGAYCREQGLFSKQLLFYLIEFSRLQVCTFSNLADICF